MIQFVITRNHLARLRVPVSPKEVEAYVFSDDNVDRVIAIIDGRLSSSEEKNYRHEGGQVGEDYYYQFSIAAKLSEPEQNQLRKAYLDAGWAAVQLRHNAPKPEEQAMLEVRIFRIHNSQYLAWEGD
jgi:hypothetical protein